MGWALIKNRTQMGTDKKAKNPEVNTLMDADKKISEHQCYQGYQGSILNSILICSSRLRGS